MLTNKVRVKGEFEVPLLFWALPEQDFRWRMDAIGAKHNENGYPGAGRIEFEVTHGRRRERILSTGVTGF